MCYMILKRFEKLKILGKPYINALKIIIITSIANRYSKTRFLIYLYMLQMVPFFKKLSRSTPLATRSRRYVLDISKARSNSTLTVFSTGQLVSGTSSLRAVSLTPMTWVVSSSHEETNFFLLCPNKNSHSYFLVKLCNSFLLRQNGIMDIIYCSCLWCLIWVTYKYIF